MSIHDTIAKIRAKLAPLTTGSRGDWTASPGPDGDDGPWHVHETSARFDVICQTAQGQDKERAEYIAATNPLMVGALLDVIETSIWNRESIRLHRKHVEDERDILKSTVEAVHADLGIEDDYPVLQKLREVLEQNEALKAENENLRNERRALLRK